MCSIENNKQRNQIHATALERQTEAGQEGEDLAKKVWNELAGPKLQMSKTSHFIRAPQQMDESKDEDEDEDEDENESGDESEGEVVAPVHI
jgi:hypothetical protein